MAEFNKLLRAAEEEEKKRYTVEEIDDLLSHHLFYPLTCLPGIDQREVVKVSLPLLFPTSPVGPSPGKLLEYLLQSLTSYLYSPSYEVKQALSFFPLMFQTILEMYDRVHNQENLSFDWRGSKYKPSELIPFLFIPASSEKNLETLFLLKYAQIPFRSFIEYLASVEDEAKVRKMLLQLRKKLQAVNPTTDIGTGKFAAFNQTSLGQNLKYLNKLLFKRKI